jgi:hypothetical protein
MIDYSIIVIITIINIKLVPSPRLLAPLLIVGPVQVVEGSATAVAIVTPSSIQPCIDNATDEETLTVLFAKEDVEEAFSKLVL